MISIYYIFCIYYIYNIGEIANSAVVSQHYNYGVCKYRYYTDVRDCIPWNVSIYMCISYDICMCICMYHIIYVWVPYYICTGTILYMYGYIETRTSVLLQH